MVAVNPPVSYLFVPATSPERIPKAWASGANQVIVDLEDGVAVRDKERARSGLFELVASEATILRVNSRSTKFFEKDLEAAIALSWIDGIMLPKVERAEDVTSVADTLPIGMKLLALIESALGVVNVELIAEARPSRMIFGSVDYLADINAESSIEALAYPRSRLVLASRAWELPTAVDGPSLAMTDGDALRRDAMNARALGMGAKLCIHPSQVGVVNEVFLSSEAERAWATAVLEESIRHGGVFRFNGAMVDAPVLKRARQILANQ